MRIPLRPTSVILGVLLTVAGCLLIAQLDPWSWSSSRRNAVASPAPARQAVMHALGLVQRSHIGPHWYLPEDKKQLGILGMCAVTMLGLDEQRLCDPGKMEVLRRVVARGEVVSAEAVLGVTVGGGVRLGGGAGHIGPYLAGKCSEGEVLSRTMAEASRVEAADARLRKTVDAESVPVWRLRDHVAAQQVEDPKARWEYVPPSERTYPREVPVRQCRKFRAYPISFGIPARNVVARPYTERAWGFCPLFMIYNRTHPPKVGNALGSTDEYVMTEMVRRSYFMFTHRRGGWDCMRHLETMAAGTVPYFPDISDCGRFCLALYPKGLFERGMLVGGARHLGRWQGRYRHAGVVNEQAPLGSVFAAGPAEVQGPQVVNIRDEGPRPYVEWGALDVKEHAAVAEAVRAYVAENMTTASIVGYLLNRVGREEPKHVLLLVRDGILDYLETTLEHGLASLGIRYTVLGRRPAAYQMRREANGAIPRESTLNRERGQLAERLHGRGNTVGFRIPGRNGPGEVMENETVVAERVRAGTYDLVISYNMKDFCTTGAAVPKAAREVLSRHQLVIANGDDSMVGHDDIPQYEAYYSCAEHLFLREMADKPC